MQKPPKKTVQKPPKKQKELRENRAEGGRNARKRKLSQIRLTKMRLTKKQIRAPDEKTNKKCGAEKGDA